MAVVLVAPQVAGAGCPGCEEYTLDIPNDGGGGDTPAPAPTAPAPAAPAPAAPAAPAPTAPTTPTTTVPSTTDPAAPTESIAAPETKPKPEDTDPDPIPGGAAVKPVSLEGIPSTSATEAAEVTDAGTDGGILPLAIALVAVGIVGLVLGFRNHGRAGEG